MEVVALAEAAPREPRPGRLARAIAAETARQAFEPRAAPPGLRRELPRATCTRLARRHGVPILLPPAGNLNHPVLAERLERDVRPDGALTLMVGQIFGLTLLETLRRPVNFHDSLLPTYRGIAATAWSVYHGEPRSGISFHHMTAGLDDGPILLYDAVDVDPRAVGGQVLRAKTRLAGSRMAEALGRIVEGDPRTVQRGEATAFTFADLRAVRAIDPGALTWDDLRRRLRAFERLDIRVGDERLDVTSVRRVEGQPRRPQLAFSTADGVCAEVTRLVHLPPAVHRLYRTIGAARRASRRR